LVSKKKRELESPKLWSKKLRGHKLRVIIPHSQASLPEQKGIIYMRRLTPSNISEKLLPKKPKKDGRKRLTVYANEERKAGAFYKYF